MGATERDIESYSGFGPDEKPTELLEKLKAAGIKTVVCVGLAFDYCVGSTAIDAAKHGFKTFIVMDGTRCVAKESGSTMDGKLATAGITCISASEVNQKVFGM